MKARQNPRVWVGLLVSVVTLAAVLALADVRTLLQALRRLPPLTLMAALALLATSIGVRAVAWRLLLGGRASWPAAFWALNAGYLVNNLIPLRAGEAARALLIAPRARISFWHALSTVMVERLLDVILLAGMLLAAIPWVLDLPQARHASWTLGGLAGTVLLALALLAAFRAPLNRILETRLTPKVGARTRKVVGWAQHFLDGLEALAQPLRFLALLLLMTLSWLVQVGAYGLTLRTLVPQANLWWAAFVLGSVGMGVAVPSAPGGLGVVEGVIVFVLHALSVDPSVALAYALAMHAVYYLVTVSLGLVGLSVYGASLQDVVRRALRREADHGA